MKVTRKIIAICLLALFLVPTVPASIPDWNAGYTRELNPTGTFSGFANGDSFLPNLGQIGNEHVLFQTKNAYFTSTGIVFRVLGNYLESQTERRSPYAEDSDGGRAFHIYDVEFEGANEVVPYAMEITPEQTNFILGSDGSKWVSGVPSFKQLVYKNIYDGIDLSFRALPEGLKYEFTVQPGADLQDIVMKYSGASLSTDGKTLVIATSVGKVNDGELVCYQEGNRVPGEMVLEGNTVRFSIEYDGSKTLTVDPLVYSTFLGGTGVDHGRAIALDSGNNAYVCGYTDSTDFPTTPGAYDTSSNAGPSDVFVTKLNASGNGTIFSTYIGGSQEDRANDIYVDSSNITYVAGYTNSSNFPTTMGAYDTTYNGVLSYDPFVLKLNANGSALTYSTYLGGSYADYVYGLDVDTNGCAYVVGYTYAQDYPTTAGAWDTAHNGGWYDVFVTKLAANGDSLSYSTYLGGSSDDYGYGIALDSNNNAYVTGETYSTNFSVTGGAYSTSNAGAFDVFVTKLNAAGSGLSYSTYLGSTGSDGGYCLEVDSSGQAYLACFAGATGFPTTANAYDTTFNTGTDVAIVKLNAAGNGLVYSSYIGGSGSDYPRWISIDDKNNSYVTGITDSVNFPTTLGAEDTSFNGGTYDVTVFVLNATGSNLTYSTYLGGAGDDYGRSIAVDSARNFYITGGTSSSAYPVTNGAFNTLYNGGGDAYVTKLKLPGRPFAPVNLTGSSGNAYIRVNWSPPNDTGGLQISNYTVYRGPAAGSLSVMATLGIAYGYNDTGVTNGIEYYYAVSATNALGEGNLTAPLNLTAGSAPGAPGGFLLDAGFRHVDISWSPPSDTGGFAISGYSVYRGPDPASLSLLAPSSNTTFNDSTVNNGITYYYAIAARNLRGEGPKCPALSATPGSAPLVPQNFTGDVWDLHVVLQWSAPSDDGGFPISGYRVFRGVSELALQYIDSSLGTLYTDNGASAGSSYYYAVSASNSRGEGPQTAPVLIAVGKVPAPPTASAIAGDASVELSWVPGDNGGFPIQAYRVYRGEQATSLSFLMNSSTTNLKDTAVTNGMTYYYAVSAVNARGEGSRSAVVSATPYGEGRLPGAPLNLTASAGNGNILVSWKPPSDTGGSAIAEYKLYKGESAANLVLVNSGTSLEYTDSSVVIGRKYFYAVSAVNAKGEGPQTPPVSALVAGEGKLPSAPRNLTASAGSGYVRLGWEAPTDNGGLEISAYKLFRGLTSSSLAQLSEQSALWYNDTVVVGGATYYYAVLAVNSKGDGPRSDPVAAVPGNPGTLPGIPGELIPKAYPDSIVLRWSAPADTGGLPIKGYSIYSGIGGSLSFHASTDGLVFIDTDVNEGTTYTYRVAAVNDKGEGPLSAAVNAAPGSPPSAPRDLAIVRQGGTNQLSWQTPARHGGFYPTGYKVYRGTNAENAVLLMNTTSLTFSDTIKNDVQYYYMVSAVNAKGEGTGAWVVAPAVSVVQPVTSDSSSDFWMPVIVLLLIIVMVIAIAAFIRAGRKGRSEQDDVDSEGYRPMDNTDYEAVPAHSRPTARRHQQAPAKAAPYVPAIPASVTPASQETAQDESADTEQEAGTTLKGEAPAPSEASFEERAEAREDGKKEQNAGKPEMEPKGLPKEKSTNEPIENGKATHGKTAPGNDPKTEQGKPDNAPKDAKEEPKMTLEEVLERLNKGR